MYTYHNVLLFLSKNSICATTHARTQAGSCMPDMHLADNSGQGAHNRN